MVVVGLLECVTSSVSIPVGAEVPVLFAVCTSVVVLVVPVTEGLTVPPRLSIGTVTGALGETRAVPVGAFGVGDTGGLVSGVALRTSAMACEVTSSGLRCASFVLDS